MLRSFGAGELLLILGLALLFFGNRLPNVAKSLGGAVRSFKRAKDGADEIEKKVTEAPARIAARADSPKQLEGRVKE